MQFGGLDVAWRTHAGRVRNENEDAIGIPTSAPPDLIRQRGYLFALADGVGGYSGGKEASFTTIATLYEQFYGAAPCTLHHAMQVANMTVRRLSMQPGYDTRMGSTLVVACFHESQIVIGHVGDSRAYLVRHDTIHQLTTDHVALHPSANDPSQQKMMVTRSIGNESMIQPDFLTISDVYPYDTIVLCSDGLSNLVEDMEIAHAVTTHTLDIAATLLLDLANERGGFDNITVVLIRVMAVSFVTFDEGVL